ncbi:MAG TPA: DUF664 domain-containing protein [Acidimicrobiales bacterium]
MLDVTEVRDRPLLVQAPGRSSCRFVDLGAGQLDLEGPEALGDAPHQIVVRNAPEGESMKDDQETGFPGGNHDERELLLSWLAYLRGAVLRNVDGLSDEEARWRPHGSLLSLLGIVNHLTHVEWRWIDGRMLGKEVSRDEDEFRARS